MRLQHVTPRFAAIVLKGPDPKSGPRQFNEAWNNESGEYDLHIQLAPKEQEHLERFVDPNGVMHITMAYRPQSDYVKISVPGCRDTMRPSNAQEFTGLSDVFTNILQQLKATGLEKQFTTRQAELLGALRWELLTAMVADKASQTLRAILNDTLFQDVLVS